MRPGAIVLGKLLASLCHLAVLVFASLPIVMLCLPLGGVSLYEVLATYLAMAASVVTFGMICVAASSYFTRTIAALVVSYLIILPLVLVGVLFYRLFEEAAEFRLVVLAVVFPAGLRWRSARCCSSRSAGGCCTRPTSAPRPRKWSIPTWSSATAVGMVIRSDQFPDRLFAPPKRTDLMDDGLNPVYDKEMRSELFGQGTLMLRLVIQLSMFLALPLMAVLPVHRAAAGPRGTPATCCCSTCWSGRCSRPAAITSERERQTLELLLTTTLSPWQILWGKLFSEPADLAAC